MIGLIVLATLLAVATLVIHYRQWHGGAAGRFVLAAVPAALLFPVLPVPVLVYRTIRGFQQIGQDGASTPGGVADLCRQMDQWLWLGSLGTLLTMVVAALLQWRAAAVEVAPASTPADGGNGRALWSERILIACSLLIVPTALLIGIAQDVPRLTIGALEITSTPDAIPPAAAELAALSQTVASRLVVGMGLGLLLSAVGVVALVAALVAADNIRQPRRAGRYGWAVFAIVMLAAAANGVRLQADLRWIERVASAATAHAASLPSRPRRPLARMPPTAEQQGPLRFDGVYRTDPKAAGTFDYWVFQRGGQCWPYSAPVDRFPPPPPPPAGKYWSWHAEGQSLVLMYSEDDAVVRTEKGSIRTRDVIVIESVTYRFQPASLDSAPR